MMIEQITWLALCVYFEARGEDPAGQIAVAHVVINRAEKRGQSIEQVIKAPAQFSWLHDDVPDQIDDFEAFVRCVRSVFLCLQDRANGITLEGADHYYNPAKVSPAWAVDMQKISLIGNHLFLKS